MNRSIVAVLGLVALATGTVATQNRRVLTTADYDRAVKMLGAQPERSGRRRQRERDLAARRALLVRPHHAERQRKRRDRPGEKDAGGRADAAGRRPGLAWRRRPRRTRRRAWRTRRWTGGRDPVEELRTECHRDDGPAAPVDVARRQEGHLHLRLEPVGEGRRHRAGAPAHDRRREGLRLRDEQRRLDDERRARAVVVARQQEDRDAAAGRAQGRRHVPGRNARQRRPSGAARLEVSAARRSRRGDDQPRRDRRRHRQDEAAADEARLSPRHVGRQHRHERISLESGRLEARVRLDRSLPQELGAPRSPTRRRAKSGPSSPKRKRRTSRRGCSGRSSGTRRKSSGTRSTTARRTCTCTTWTAAS